MRKLRSPRPPRAKYHGYVFTLYDITLIQKYILRLQKNSMYLVMGRETCPTTNREHIQGYFYLVKPLTERRARLMIPTCHMEIARESPEANFLYCSKNADFYSFGGIASTMKHWECKKIPSPLKA